MIMNAATYVHVLTVHKLCSYSTGGTLYEIDFEWVVWALELVASDGFKLSTHVNGCIKQFPLSGWACDSWKCTWTNHVRFDQILAWLLIEIVYKQAYTTINTSCLCTIITTCDVYNIINYIFMYSCYSNTTRILFWSKFWSIIILALTNKRIAWV